MLKKPDGTALIGINAAMNPPRQRFTLAHELGHLRLGHETRIDTTATVLDSGSFSNHLDPQEVAANQFAAEFLCPIEATLRWFSDHTESPDAPAVCRFALTFGLSFPAAALRLVRSGLAEPQSANSVLADLTANAGVRIRAAKAEGAQRLDEIERLHGVRDYPRLPARLLALADRALDLGLLDVKEHAALRTPNASPGPGIE